MTYRLVEDPDGVSALAGRVSDATGLPASHVEKDFWVTEVLRGVVSSAARQGIDVHFKGGTSLSKVFGMIHRFSEDVDMLVLLPDGSNGAKDRALKELVRGAEGSTRLEGVVDGSTVTTGVKRSARFTYPTAHPAAGVSEGVLLELGSRGGGLMAAPAQVRSLIAEHLPEDIAEAAEVEPVTVRVMAPWRTLVEKLVLLHTAHTGDDERVAVKGARHFYDVHQLLNRPEVLSGVAEAGIGAIARDVCTYSRAAGLPAEERPNEGFAVSPAFNGGPHVAAARAEYDQRVVGELLWPDAVRPSFEECVETVRVHADDL